MRTRSIFWPLVLLATGFIWLLISLAVVPPANLWALVKFFPYFLLALGLGLVLRARWETAGRLVSVLAVGLAVLAVVFAAPLGWDATPRWAPPWEIDGWSWSIPMQDESGGVAGSGEVVTKTRELPSFSSITLEFPAQVFISQGESQSVTIEGDDNLLPQVVTSVSGGELTIARQHLAYDERVRPTRTVIITLVVTDLDRLDIPGAGEVRLEDLQTSSLSVSVSGAADVRLSGLDLDSLDVHISGAGSVEAGGSADDLEVDLSGVGSFEGGDLEAQTAEVSISGTGSAVCWVTGRLSAEISGIGSLSYYGSPTVIRSVSGLGSVDRLGDK